MAPTAGPAGTPDDSVYGRRIYRIVRAFPCLSQTVTAQFFEGGSTRKNKPEKTRDNSTFRWLVEAVTTVLSGVFSRPESGRTKTNSKPGRNRFRRRQDNTFSDRLPGRKPYNFHWPVRTLFLPEKTGIQSLSDTVSAKLSGGTTRLSAVVSGPLSTPENIGIPTSFQDHFPPPVQSSYPLSPNLSPDRTTALP